MDYQRAVQAYLWALPYVSMAQWQNEQREKFGAQNLDYVDYLDFKDKLGLLTANARRRIRWRSRISKKPGRWYSRFRRGRSRAGTYRYGLIA